MSQGDARDQEIAALRERLSRLSEASLRINESLDVDAVLQGVLDSARALTGASYGAFILLDDAGAIEDFLSSGLSAEEAGRMWALEDGLRFFESLSGSDEPLRLPDLLGHLRAQGLPELRPPVEVGSPLSFLAAPVLHVGRRVGHLFVSQKETGGEFSDEDEETLVMFASQAALVIANARRHRDERRARTDLETLMHTAPMAVGVLDAGTGALVSFNRELDRLADGLRDPEQTTEQLLEVLTIRRADGREFSLEELPLAQALREGEAVRAEEIVLRVPDGRSVRALLNATPIRSAEGEVESFVVALQDMTPLEEQERLRTEFLAMVSHELRAPLTSVKGSVATLLDPPAPLNPSETREFFAIIDDQIDRMHVLVGDLLDVARVETGTLAVAPQPADVAALAGEARNAFRSGGGRHEIEIELAADLPWVMADGPRLVQVLRNLLTNAAANSPESSPIRVSAAAEDLHVAVSVTDAGGGIPAERLPLLFRKFSRLDGGGERHGETGLGLAICKGIVETHGGRIWAESEGLGLGARFTFTIPTVEQAGYVSPVTAAPPPVRSARRRAAQQVRVLAVDDDPEALRYVQDALLRSDYAPIVTHDPEQALRLLEEERPHVVLLDLMLPGTTDGIALMRSIADRADVPVIFLSAYGQDQLVANALDEGAADYLVKPYSAVELAARIRAALRRQETPEPSAPYVLGDLTIDYAERLVSLAGRPLELTDIEYRALAELASHAGRIVTYEQLLRRVWRTDADADPRPMRTAVASLRRKLGDDAEDPTYIFTQLRVGYRMPEGETTDPEQG